MSNEIGNGSNKLKKRKKRSTKVLKPDNLNNLNNQEEKDMCDFERMKKEYKEIVDLDIYDYVMNNLNLVEVENLNVNLLSDIDALFPLITISEERDLYLSIICQSYSLIEINETRNIRIDKLKYQYLRRPNLDYKCFFFNTLSLVDLKKLGLIMDNHTYLEFINLGITFDHTDMKIAKIGQYSTYLQKDININYLKNLGFSFDEEQYRKFESLEVEIKIIDITKNLIYEFEMKPFLDIQSKYYTKTAII